LVVGGSLMMAATSSMIYAAVATYLLNRTPGAGATSGEIAEYMRVQERAGFASFICLVLAGVVAGVSTWAVAADDGSH
jgi:hypothetical protein